MKKLKNVSKVEDHSLRFQLTIRKSDCQTCEVFYREARRLDKLQLQQGPGTKE